MKEYTLTSGFLDRPRRLILTADYLEWEHGDLKGSEFTRFDKSDIVDFKHGLDWIVWHKFIVGRSYSISLKDRKGKEIRIRFHSYFGLRKDNYQKYSGIIDDIWTLYQTDIVDSFVDRFVSGGEVQIQGIKLSKDGIELRDAKGFVPWDRVTTKDYERYFVIYHQDNPNAHSRVSNNEYGTEILWSAVKTILKGKSLDVSA